MARVYADVNQNLPRSYWDYDSVNISKLISSLSGLLGASLSSARYCCPSLHKVSFSGDNQPCVGVCLEAKRG